MITESGGDDSFKEFSDVAEEANRAVASDFVGVFSGFVDHGDECSLPG